ncbi:YndJ family transporter [Leptospira kanakyensis]|uniref:YndJ family transporter n=1 Tax=Leptospira kanakyensis TaxID=2484968 RepID=UPI00223E7030|nr:YndJ family transporter [Leptospira kanakyensis]MCW7471574.1 YndJ family transporter [Leptospira kanakyensis]
MYEIVSLTFLLYVMYENFSLHGILCFGYLIAPFFTNQFFLNQSKVYTRFHLISITLVILAIYFRIPKLSFVWILFSGFGMILFYKIHRNVLFQFNTWIKFFPLGFSSISSVWFFCGTNECSLLGYNTTWSYYAAIHSCYIGWLFLSGVIFLFAKNQEQKTGHFIVLTIVILFLMIAFGIYGNPNLKKFGVIGYLFLLPFSLIHSNILFQNQNPISRILARSSLFFLCLTLLLATFNEFYIGFPKYILGYPLMVVFHGMINAFLVIPCFLGSILFREMKTVP